MRIAITTTDAEYAAMRETDDQGRVIVTIPDAQVERLTFAGRDMIRFDLRLAGNLPKGWANPFTMYPVSRIAS